MKTTLAPLSILLAVAHSCAAEPPVAGNSTIRGQFADSEIVITTTSRLAGAIHSLTWKGREFIDSTDHGRQLQSACSFGEPRDFWAECYNPTEAGSRKDGAGPTSTSKLLQMSADGGTLQTITQMAFWLEPGERSQGRPARNTSRLSNHVLLKTVRIGYRDWPNVLQYDVTFRLPAGERHKLAQFESLTGYMPAEFAIFHTFNPEDGELRPLSDGPGEQENPVVLSTASGSHAMGIFAPRRLNAGHDPPGYGRWRFSRERVVKWNCVFRVRAMQGVEPGDYSFRHFVVLGDRATVVATLRDLHEQHHDQPLP